MTQARNWQELRDKALRDPEVRASFARSKEQLDRAVQTRCSEGVCVEWHDPKTGEHLGGYGPVGCPCQTKEQS